jgi:hypothetical protein
MWYTAVSDEMIKLYVENQLEEDGDFKIWNLEQKLEGEKALSRMDSELKWL